MPEEQTSRIQHEADRIAAMVNFAAAYGCKVHLNHRSWFGVISNQLAVLVRLKEMGIAMLCV